MKEYKGASLRYIPLHANGAQSIFYDILSMISCIGKGYDAVLVLGVSGCIFLPIFRLLFKKKIVVNIDGLEHRRDKWGKIAKKFLLFSEKCAVRFADIVVADNKAIKDYVRETYSKDAELIAYGGDHALREVSGKEAAEVLQKYNLNAGSYAITVCRIEPENNCHIILDAFSASKQNLVFIGNWNRSEYGKSLKEKYRCYDNIKILDPIYDLDVLYVLRSNAGIYVHGHSAGGTNPSLVEAMCMGVPIVAFDVIYNRETTHGEAMYFSNAGELSKIRLSGFSNSLIGKSMIQIAGMEYAWSVIVKKYEAILK